MNEEEEIFGCLGSGEAETDYVLCDGDIDTLPTLYKQDEVRYEYNQANQSRSKVSCTIFSAVGMLSDLKNYEFTLDEIKEIDELSYTKGRTRNKGRYVQSAVKLVADRRNEKHSDDKVAYYRMKVSTSDIDSILEKGYTLIGNCCPTSAYTKDYKKDAVLDGCDFGTNTNGHAIDLIWNSGKRSLKDSYKGRKTTDGTKDCNIFEIKHSIDELTNFGPNFYIYTNVKEDNYGEIKRLNEIKTLLVNAIETNSNMRNLVNDTTFKEQLHSMNESNRSKLEYINEQLKKLS